MNDKISVVVATYNHAKYLPTAVESLLGQYHDNLEIIVIDNASTDNTQDIASSLVALDKTRVRYVRNETNLQKATSVNKAVSMCTGDYYALNDADDASHPMRFKRQLMVMKSWDVCHVMTQGYVMEPSTTLLDLQKGIFDAFLPFDPPRQDEVIDKYEVYDKILSIRDNPSINWFPVPNDYNGAHGVSPLTKIDVWKNGIRFNPGNHWLRMKSKQGEDSDINYRTVLLLKSTAVLLEPLYIYRQNTSTNTDYPTT